MRCPTAIAAHPGAIACGEHLLFGLAVPTMLNCCTGSNTSPRSESITALCTGASWVGSDRYRPRRVRCRGCGATQVLLPAALQPRRADCTEVIGTALARKAEGLGHRRIAAALGRSPSTVRRWLRRAPRPRSSQPAVAARRAGADPAQRRGVQRACEHRQPAARHPDRSGRRGLVGASTAGHCRASVDPHRALHPRAPSRAARLSPSTARPTAGPALSHARLRPSR